jgi:LPXTG-site transpeptidase (sortase) family protein
MGEETYITIQKRKAGRRFLRTFALSFGVSLILLYIFGFAPQGLSDTPRRVFQYIASTFKSAEAVVVSALPGRTLVGASVGGVALVDTVNELAGNKVKNASTTTSETPLWKTSQPLSGNLYEPRSLHIPTVGITVPIVTPTSTTISALDTALADGVVRYPGSGNPGERTNILFFGHSSNLPVVHNPAYRALNKLEDVRLGDDVYVRSGEREYHYKVFAVRLTTDTEELVTFTSDERQITISTCNTFGQKSERFVVQAIYVGSKSL